VPESPPGTRLERRRGADTRPGCARPARAGDGDGHMRRIVRGGLRPRRGGVGGGPAARQWRVDARRGICSSTTCPASTRTPPTTVGDVDNVPRQRPTAAGPTDTQPSGPDSDRPAPLRDAAAQPRRPVALILLCRSHCEPQRAWSLRAVDTRRVGRLVWVHADQQPACRTFLVSSGCVRPRRSS